MTLPKVPIFFISFSVGLFSSLRNRAVEWTSKSYLSVHIDVLQCHFLLLNICQRNLREKKLATLCHYHRNKPSQTFGHVCHQINTRMDKSEFLKPLKVSYILKGARNFQKSPSFLNPQTKGQLISKCPYEVAVWTKIATKIFPRFLF